MCRVWLASSVASKPNTWNKTSLLLTMQQEFRFWTDVKAARQTSSVCCAVLNSYSDSSSVFSSSVLLPDRQASEIKMNKGPFHSSTDSSSGSTVDGRHARDLWKMVRTGPHPPTLCGPYIGYRISVMCTFAFGQGLFLRDFIVRDTLRHAKFRDNNEQWFSGFRCCFQFGFYWRLKICEGSGEDIMNRDLILQRCAVHTFHSETH